MDAIQQCLSGGSNVLKWLLAFACSDFDEDIMPLRGRFDRVYFRKRRNVVLLALNWFCFRFICNRCSFVLALFSVVGVLLWTFSTTSVISQ